EPMVWCAWFEGTKDAYALFPPEALKAPLEPAEAPSKTPEALSAEATANGAGQRTGHTRGSRGIPGTASHTGGQRTSRGKRHRASGRRKREIARRPNRLNTIINRKLAKTLLELARFYPHWHNSWRRPVGRAVTPQWRSYPALKPVVAACLNNAWPPSTEPRPP